MPPKTKRQIELELRHAKVSLKNVNASKDLVFSQMEAKELKVRSLEREVERLKAVLVKVDRTTLETAASQTRQRDDPDDDSKQNQRQVAASDQDGRNTNTTPRESPLIELQRERIRQQQKLLEGGERENEILRNTCSQQVSKIADMETKLDQSIRDNRAQTSKLEDYLLQEALHQQTVEDKNKLLNEQEKELRELRNQSAKIAGSKRSLTKYLQDIDFFQAKYDVKAERKRSKVRDSRVAAPLESRPAEQSTLSEQITSQPRNTPARPLTFDDMRSSTPAHMRADRYENINDWQTPDIRNAGSSWDELDPIMPRHVWYPTKHESTTPTHKAGHFDTPKLFNEGINNMVRDEVVNARTDQQHDEVDQLSEDEESLSYPDDVKDDDYDPENDWDVQTDI